MVASGRVRCPQPLPTVVLIRGSFVSIEGFSQLVVQIQSISGSNGVVGETTS